LGNWNYQKLQENSAAKNVEVQVEGYFLMLLNKQIKS
jgi:hypothetical protein